MTEEFTPLARRNQSLGLKAKAFFFCKEKPPAMQTVFKINKIYYLLLILSISLFTTGIFDITNAIR